MFEQISNDNWIMYALKSYDNPTLQKEQEFYEDIKRFKYLKRLFRKYIYTGELNVRLVINHIIILQNVFGSDACVTLLLFKLDRKFWPALKSVLNYLNYLYPHELKEIPVDKAIALRLKEL